MHAVSYSSTFCLPPKPLPASPASEKKINVIHTEYIFQRPRRRNSGRFVFRSNTNFSNFSFLCRLNRCTDRPHLWKSVPGPSTAHRWGLTCVCKARKQQLIVSIVARQMPVNSVVHQYHILKYSEMSRYRFWNSFVLKCWWILF